MIFEGGIKPIIFTPLNNYHTKSAQNRFLKLEHSFGKIFSFDSFQKLLFVKAILICHTAQKRTALKCINFNDDPMNVK